jgi:hypothetical protein
MCEKITAAVQLALCWLLSGISSLLPLGRCLPQTAATAGLFNRYTIRYTSEAPLVGEISYRVGSREKTE